MVSEEDGVGCWKKKEEEEVLVRRSTSQPGVDGGCSKKEETRKCRVEDPAVLLPLLGFSLICCSAHSFFLL